jgi:hypothetical protein
MTADFDPRPLDPADPVGDLLDRALGLICSAHYETLDEVTEEHALPGWAAAARWWLDRYHVVRCGRPED